MTALLIFYSLSKELVATAGSVGGRYRRANVDRLQSLHISHPEDSKPQRHINYLY